MKVREMLKVNLRNKLGKWGLSVIAVSIGGVVILASLMIFRVQTDKALEQFVRGSMDDLNQAASITLNSNFENFTVIVEQQAQLLNAMDSPSKDKLMDAITNFSNLEGFKNVAILTNEGAVLSSFRGITAIHPEDILPNLNNPDTVVSQPRAFYDGSLVVDISTPLTISGMPMGKLVVSIDSDYLANMLPSNLQNGDVAFNLLMSDGTLIARSSMRSSSLQPNNSIFDFYTDEDVEIIDGSLPSLRSALENGTSTWLKYSYQGETTVGASFQPLERNGWYIATIITGSTLYAQSEMIQTYALFLTAIIMFIVIGVAIVVILQRIKEQERVDKLKNTYSIAIKKTNDLFYEADIDRDVFTDYSEKKDKAVWRDAPKKYSSALLQVANVCAPEFRDQFLNTLLPQNIRIKMKEGISSISFEYKITPREQQERWLSATFVPVDDGSNGIKLICMENDITDHVIMREQLTKSATIDGLSGLYNKMSTQSYIEHFLKTEGIQGHHAFVLLDIDQFKSINDTLGHARGDEVIAGLGSILQRIFRKSDIIGRLGGDEFVIFLKDYNELDLINQKLLEVKKAFRKEYSSENDHGIKLYATTSIGVSLYDNGEKTFTTLYKEADTALYASKQSGKDCCTFYHSSLSNDENKAV